MDEKEDRKEKEEDSDEVSETPEKIDSDSSEKTIEPAEETAAEQAEEPNEKEDNNIDSRDVSREMKQSYLDYSMSVIVGRALPDVRDGLKPVHRRILHAMNEMGMTHTKAFKKSARIVGEVLGKYHPHGDSSVYDALVRMVQDFSLRYPLIQGQGNFGSIDGDSAAAMRYTEARLQKMSEDLLVDIEKETVAFGPNFDNSLTEPLVIPSKIPNLLVNGSSGIAVGMATNIPPHNMEEVCDGVISVIKDPEIEPKELLGIVKGPDFPTGGIIQGRRGIESAYLTGKGRCVVRSKSHVEDFKNNRQRIIITEIPYQVNKSLLIEHIAALVRDKKMDGISDLRDESDREGMRIVIELKTGANSEIVLNQLYKHTRLQDTFGIILLALTDGRPVVMTLKEIITHFIEHRFEVVQKRTQFDLKKAKERAHILEGLITALDHIDAVIKKIRASADAKEAQETLMEDYDLTEVQAKAILEMRLQKLASLEQKKIKDEHKQLLELIDDLESILASDERIYDIIIEETESMKEAYGDKRRTDILEGGDEDYDIDMEDLIDKEDMILTITHLGYIKRLALDTYKEQRRGGKGVRAQASKEEDFVEDLFIANTHDYLMFFTDRGQVHWLKVYKIPEASRTARGTAIVNLIGLEPDEKVTAFVSVKDFAEGNLMMTTQKGVIKKCKLDLFSRPRKGGIRAINLQDGDALIEAKLTTEKDNIIIATRNGKAIKFRETDIRPIGRTGMGVRGIRLKKDDKVIGMVIADDKHALLTLTENGYGKRSPISDYRLINRGGSGVINIICSDRNGKVVGIRSTEGNESLVLISQSGIAIRISSSDISIIGRNTQGVRVMKLKDGDRVVASAKIINEDNEDEMPGSDPSGD